ncbi:MAG: ABC transporter permease, partial [Eubacteriales bacterium]|nr:ABC transporter permease [Eubacteriales bacterium]
YSGLNSKNVILLAYVISGVCAGIAGLIYASRIGVADANNAGLYNELDAILAVVIGGTSMSGGKFSLAGSLVGALIIRTIITTVYYFGVAAEATMVFRAAIVVVVIILQSEPVRAWMSRKKRDRKAMSGGGAAA